MDGRDLLSYFDDDDDFYPIAVMTPSGLRVIEISNDDHGMVGFRWDSTDPERYEFIFSGSSVVLLPPSEQLLAKDPPYLIMPVVERQPEDGDHYYDGRIIAVNAPGMIMSFGGDLPFEVIIWQQ